MELSCESDFNMKKCAAITIKTPHCGIGTLVYDKLMRHWIRTELGVDIPCIGEVMQKTCWGCGEVKEDLQQCKGKVNLTRYRRITMSYFLQFAKSPNIVPRNVKS